LRKGIILAVIATCFVGICYLLWKEYFKYTLPASIPYNYKSVKAGETISLFKEHKGLMLLHFYNPNCPCSKFNSTYIRQLYKKHKDELSFFVVVEKAYLKDYKNQFDFNLIEDDGSLADSLGVYATPQAVILKDGILVYRGNYNKTRFCTDKDTYFPEMVLDSLLNNKPLPKLPAAASQSYGCNLHSDLKYLNIQ
jgi:hypothetical protein